MLKTQRFITSILLCIIVISNLATPVAYAAPLVKFHIKKPAVNFGDASTLTQSSSALQPDQGSILGVSTSLVTDGTVPITLEGENGDSANIRIAPRMAELPKRVYRTDEDVILSVINPDDEPFSTKVTDAKGKNVVLPVTEVNNGTTTSVDLSSSDTIRPGRYAVAITDSHGQITTQDFTWGVLAMNFDKSEYHPGESADISFGVLNDNGDMVCDADLILKVTNSALGVNDSLTNASAATSSAQIMVSPQCQSHDFSLEPDYYTHYKFGRVGTYQLQLTATTSQGSYTIADSIQVTNDIPFDVQRVSATRIYPPNTYPMLFNITANRDFSGTVTETVPDSFTITPATQSAVAAEGATGSVSSYDNMQTIYLNNNDPAANLQEAIIASDSGGLVMPFIGDYPITQGFGAQLTDPALQSFYTSFGLAGHDGVDFGVPMFTSLYAVDNGTVIWSGPGDYGTTIIIRHGWGESYYGHLSSTVAKVGESVSKGQLIGYSGESGDATGPHLHFGMRPNNPDMTNGYYGKIDPLPYLPFGHEPQPIAAVTPATATGQQLFASAQVVLGSSDSAGAQDVSETPTSGSQQTVQPSVTVSPTPSPLPITEPTTASGSAVPSISPPETNGSLVSPTPQASIEQTDNATPAANEGFSVLDKQIQLDEALSASTQTEKVKVITWQVNLKKGQKITLGYDYQAPRVSPEFYLLGPMKFYEGRSNKIVFQEQRQWEIASDDVGIEWFYQPTAHQYWNGYGWQKRQKIDIHSSEVSTSPSEPTATFMDPGGSATETNAGFYSEISADAPTNECTTYETPPCAYNFNATASGDQSAFGINNVLQDAGSRISLWVDYTHFASSGNFNALIAVFTSNEGTEIVEVNVVDQTATTALLCINTTSGAACGSTDISTNTWYHITFSYTLATTTTNAAKLYVNDALYASATNQTWTATGSNNLTFGALGSGAADDNVNLYIDDIYIDKGSDLGDPGAILVTDKLPFSNGTTNSFTTSGTPSGYGTGNAEYVNERPVNTATSHVQVTTTTTQKTEEYDIESQSSGDINLTGDTIVNSMGWIYATESTVANSTTNMIINGNTYPVTLSTSNAFYMQPTGSAVYPLGTGTDIGMNAKNSTTSTTYKLYAAGVMVAYETSSSSLTNFPVLVSISGDTSLANYAQNNGTDILFTDSTGETLLPYEIESYSSGTLVAWVNISSLSATNDTIIYMYYGNPSASSLANAPNTWNSNYVAVYHMSQNPGGSAPQMTDSTTNGNNATSNGSMTSGNQVAGKIDGSLSFGGSQYLTVPSSTSLNTVNSAITISAWVNANSSSLGTLFNRVLTRNTSPSQDWWLENDGSEDNGTLTFSVNGNGPFDYATALTSGTWYYLVVTGNSADTMAYLNGSLNVDTGVGTGGSIATTGGVGIGADTDGTTPWNGDIDEVRISNIVRSPGWIQTEYNNESAPSSFSSLGSVETDVYAPTIGQLMRHGEFFGTQGAESGARQPFTF